LTELIRWRPDWQLGVEHLDDQHRRLAGLLNSLLQACDCAGADAGDEEHGRRVAGLLDELYSLTQQHFRDEEDLMRAEGFPGLAGHAREHQMLLGEFKSTLIARLREACCNMDPQTLAALRSWFVVHIARSDREFAEWLERRHPAARGLSAADYAD
jgi:hemerythrin